MCLLALSQLPALEEQSLIVTRWNDEEFVFLLRLVVFDLLVHNCIWDRTNVLEFSETIISVCLDHLFLFVLDWIDEENMGTS